MTGGDNVPAAGGDLQPAAVIATGERSSSSRWAWATLLASVIVLAVALPVYRARSSTRTVTTMVTASARSVPQRGCDVGFEQCTVAPVRASTVAALRRHFARAVVVDSYALSNDASSNAASSTAGRVDAEYVQVRTSTRVLVSVQSHCAGGSAAVPDRAYGDTAVVGPARRVFIGGGRNGCSVAVVVDVPAGVAVPAAAATALALDPVVALR